MKTTNSIVIKVLEVFFSLTFVGLCIKASVILVSFIGGLLFSAEAANELYFGYNLSGLYSFSKIHYIFAVSLFIALTGLKAFIAYLIVEFFLKFKLSKPFNRELTDIFLWISHVSLGTGILAIIANGYCKWISKKGIAVPIDWSASEILFFAGVIYLIALVFEKGTDLQSESDLTV
ncbi:DUF2975 domain-containing protein [Lunatibacter salilacus]|uniref:DUF2975 domain-containing protein n=1 Tax=Lunatibacter salilacus TaxID=2483804 RepID=UPI00131D6714|nr:DUF2975 domain-containing protein [Lunatibacter salilacus]